MAKQQVIILGLLFATLCGCGNRSNNNEKKQDEFYTVTGGWDWMRVPLLKPYEAKKVDPKTETNQWSVAFERMPGATNVKSVAVNDSIIFLQCGDSTLLDYKYIKAAWFAIDVRTKTEKGFASEEEFTAYIKEKNYPAPHWHDIDSLSEVLGNKGKLPWMPK
jgi:hypothetical protein